ncbi:hypothetical protein [Pseudomonas putida]|uniref:hypothetical protein n=1 Tax=Pseudomonas putida TaxID=303 RepID=UPI0011AF7C92|nr:hypothetical protein [Pseudomonas putida]MCE0962194.1 TniQ family protein [Pseudomonas putida]QPN45441.1 hypothetical protein I5S86_00655 [Priestia aryabhattai]
MLLRIQPDESLRSYVERNLYLQFRNSDLDILKSADLRYYSWSNRQIKLLASIMGWHGCYGFNKLVHLHTDYPFRNVFKPTKLLAYSGTEFVSGRYCFDSLATTRTYCPLCVSEDIKSLGYSYWRRFHPHITVCAKHNVDLLSSCEFCEQPFSRDGHSIQVMWSGCAGRSLGSAEPVANKDPFALRLAKFYEKICFLEHYLILETVLLILESKFKTIDNESVDLGLRKCVDEFLADRELREHDGHGFIIHENRVFDLLDLITLAYESFEEFLGDYLSLDPDPAPIESCWSTYRIRYDYFDHYIEEDYRHGVALWSLCFFDPYVGHPLRDRRPRIYRCCNVPDSRRDMRFTPRLVKASLPSVPRLGATGWAPVITKKSPVVNRSSSDDASDPLLQ